MKTTLKEMIESRGMKPAELARRMGEIPQTVNGWLNRGRIPIEKAYKAAKVLDCQPSELNDDIPENAKELTRDSSPITSSQDFWNAAQENGIMDLSGEDLLKIAGQMEAAALSKLKR